MDSPDHCGAFRGSQDAVKVSAMLGIAAIVIPAVLVSVDWAVEHEYIKPRLVEHTDLQRADEEIKAIADEALSKVVAMEKKDFCRNLWSDIVYWRGQAKSLAQGSPEQLVAQDKWERAQRKFNEIGC